jgi:replicative DNA helicase
MLCLGARTSHGKSAMAMQMALNLADAGSRICYLSLEMSSEQLLERAFSYFCLVDSRLIRVGQAKAQIERGNSLFMNLMTGAKMLVDDRYGYDFQKVLEIATLIKPDFLFIDYIQMISTKGYKSKLEAIEEYVRKLKELSIMLGFGVVLVSQINRSGEENMGMHHLKGAGVLEEHSDTVALLDWDRQQDEYTVTVAKQRHGPTGEVRLNFEPKYFRFTEPTVHSTTSVLPSVSGKVYRTPSQGGLYSD